MYINVNIHQSSPVCNKSKSCHFSTQWKPLRIGSDFGQIFLKDHTFWQKKDFVIKKSSRVFVLYSDSKALLCLLCQASADAVS